MIVFDIEANGLFREATKIHCMSYTTDGKIFVSTCDYDAMRNILLNQKVLIGHNITRYDIPLLNKLLGIKIKAKLYDTLAMSWVACFCAVDYGLSGLWTHDEYDVSGTCRGS